MTNVHGLTGYARIPKLLSYPGHERAVGPLWEIRGQAKAQRFFLDRAWGIAGINDDAVDGDHPGQRIVREFAGQAPVWIEWHDAERVQDHSRPGRAGALADPEQFAQPARAHVGCLALVEEEIHAANGVDDRAGSGLALPLRQR